MRVRPDLRRVCVVAALLCAVAAHAAPWGPQDFPNPKRDTALCGRRKASNICDPDGILSSEKAGDRVEGVIKDIWEGQDPYTKAPCGDQGMEGFQVRFLSLAPAPPLTLPHPSLLPLSRSPWR